MSGSSWNRFACLCSLTLHKVLWLGDLHLLRGVVSLFLFLPLESSLLGYQCSPFLELPQEKNYFSLDFFPPILFSFFLCFSLYFFFRESGKNTILVLGAEVWLQCQLTHQAIISVEKLISPFFHQNCRHILHFAVLGSQMNVPIYLWQNSDQFFGKNHFCSSKQNVANIFLD